MKNCWWIFRPRPVVVLVPRPRIIQRIATVRAVRRTGTWTLVCVGSAGGVKGTQALLESLNPPISAPMLLPHQQAMLDRAHTGQTSIDITQPVPIPTPEAFELLTFALITLFIIRRFAR
jgi:hypothetical protein